MKGRATAIASAVALAIPAAAGAASPDIGHADQLSVASSEVFELNTLTAPLGSTKGSVTDHRERVAGR